MKPSLLPAGLALLVLATQSTWAAPRLEARWTQSRVVEGINKTVLVEQWLDESTGREETQFFDEQGRALPESFVRLNQVSLRDLPKVRVRAERSAGGGSGAAPIPLASLYAVRPSARLVLPYLDPQFLIQEDRVLREEKGGRRIGVLRKLLTQLRVDESLSWTALPDGSSLCTVSIESPGAEGIRLHLEDVTLPEGALLQVSGNRDPSEAHGPYTAADVRAGELWTETVFQPGVTLECLVPSGADKSAVTLSVKELAHAYIRISALFVQPRESTCHNSAVCYPEWSTQVAAVSGIGSVGDDGFLFCTGCLIADADTTSQINYYMTANHCVGSQAEANTLEFYWFFQPPTCGGVVPDASDVPRTGGGADYLAGSSRYAGTDFTLLRMRNNPPGGVGFAGWSSATPAVNSAITGIHHPDGAYKRISFGALVSSAGNFHNVRWSSGVTEPGSSGSPLFNAAKEFIGQLYGGRSYCWNPRGLDEYGRFDKTFPMIQNYLRPTAGQLYYFEDPRDYDGDGASDLAVFQPGPSVWHILQSTAGYRTQQFGFAGTIQVAGDFDGDGKSDITVYYPAAGLWFILQSSNNTTVRQQFGFNGTWPVAADYDGDGRTDIAVYDPRTSVWYINRTTAGFIRLQYGFSGVQPIPCDFDGDGKSDIAVFNPTSATWYIAPSGGGGQVVTQFGTGSSTPVPYDFDGDGRHDIAVFNSAEARWNIQRSTLGFTTFVFGSAGGYPQPFDFDDDGKADAATYQLQTGIWTIQRSSGGTTSTQFGWSGAPPVGVR